jgi:hypothetical protein
MLVAREPRSTRVRASSRPSRTEANWPTPDGAFKEPCGDLGGASAHLALNLSASLPQRRHPVTPPRVLSGASVALANAPADADRRVAGVVANIGN